jgi:aminopeptidase N
MEYPMATLIAAPNTDMALHELIHNWFYGMMANNESEYAWMDEGFTTWAAYTVLEEYKRKGDGNAKSEDIVSAYRQYLNIGIQDGKEEPMATYSNYLEPGNFSTAVYFKGVIFIEQLGYVVGATVRDKILLEYSRTWKFKHPNPDDFMRVAEKISDMKLGWYKNYWINTTKTIDYSVDSVWEANGKVKIRLRKIGQMPMPIDLLIEFKDNSKRLVYIPMYLMFGEKPTENKVTRQTLEPWKFTHPVYEVELNVPLSEVKNIEIDPSQRMADVDRSNNVYK